MTCRKTPILLLLGCFLAAAGYCDASFRRHLADLNSNREHSRERAAAALIEGGDAAAVALGKYLHTQAKSYRQAAYAFLPKIPGEASGAILAERTVIEPNDELRGLAVSILRQHLTDGARKRLLELVEDDSATNRQRAAGVIATLKDPASLDALIDRLAKEVAAGKSGGGLGLNVGVSRVDGYDTHRRSYVISTPNGPKVINQDIRMPRISGTSVSTKVGLPAAQALVSITGQNFGTDVAQWRQWRAKHYRSK